MRHCFVSNANKPALCVDFLRNYFKVIRVYAASDAAQVVKLRRTGITAQMRVNRAMGILVAVSEPRDTVAVGAHSASPQPAPGVWLWADFGLKAFR